VAIADDYRVYRETIATGLRILRPHAEVRRTSLEALEEELERFDPQVIIGSGHKDLESNGSRTWIELSLDPTQPTKISAGGRYLERVNPSVSELLEFVGEFE
jgi:hypothetical protein